MRAARLFVMSCVVAAFVPFVPVERTVAPSAGFPGWPALFENRPLQPVELSSREASFGEAFPGRIGKFTDGERVLIIRWVTGPTRKLHPAAHCLRAAGFSVRPLPLFRDARGALWGVAECEKERERLRVRELISDVAGTTWSDVSSWYWGALLGWTTGPWWAVTVVEGI